MAAAYVSWKPTVASWIWPEGQDKPDNSFVQFRKPFDLTAVPPQAVVHASADCRYLLFVNDQPVGRGPVTTNPKFKQVDVYQVAPFLKPGKNVLAAYVLQRHRKNSRYWPARGGFILELTAGSLRLGTDRTWKCRWAIESKSDTPNMTHQNGPQEWVDARLAPVGWQQADFDDRDWQNPLEIQNPCRFWPEALEVRTVPHMLREIIHPVRVVGYYGIGCRKSVEEEHEPARQLEVDYVLSGVIGWNVDNLLHPEKGPAVFQENVGNGVGVVVDLGEEMYGFPFIDIECPAGVTVDIGHGEVLSRNRIQTNLYPESHAEQRYADRYTTRDGRQRFEIFEHKGCRYLQVHFRRIPKHESGGSRITVHQIGFVRSRAPIELKTEFSSSDETLNRVFDICRRTADVICQDWHICDAQREQNNWVELYQDMLMWQVFGRVEMLRMTIEMFGRDQLPAGFIPSTVPSIYDKVQTPEDQYIFTTCAFPMAVYLDWLYGGLDDRQAHWLAYCQKVYNCLLGYLGPDGVPVNTPGSHWAEWTGMDARPGDCGRPVKNTWEVTFFCCWLILGLQRLADFAQSLGHAELADSWRQKAADIRAAADKRYWSEQRQAYIDGIYDGQPSDTVSQSTNALAILARLGHRDRLLTAAATILDPQRCDVESGINNMSMLHDALESINADRVVPDRIRNKWKKMLDLGATTTWEGFEALERNCGCCFGFGAHPLNYIARNLLGVVPLDPGYRRFSLRIAPHDLTHVDGAVATPFGHIKVSWRRQSNSLTVQLHVPEGCTAHVALPRTFEEPKFSAATLNGCPVNLEPLDVACGSFLREKAPAFTAQPGPHEVAFR